MFKTFIAALVPAAVLARGIDDGSSAENAHTSFMIDNSGDGVQTWVHTWNKLSEEDYRWQLWGETELKINKAFYNSVSYGFCMANSAENAEKMNCQQINFSYKEDGKNEDMFDIVDIYHDGDLEHFAYNSGYEDAQAADWIIDYDNSSVNCSLDWMGYVTCSDLIVRWRRDFDKNGKLSGSELTLADQCKEIPAYSFVYQWETPLWTSGSNFPYGTPYGETYNWYPTSVVMQPVNCQAHPVVVE